MREGCLSDPSRSRGASRASLFENVNGTFGPAANLLSGSFDSQVVGVDDVDGDGLTDVLCGPFEDDVNGSDLLAFRRTGPGLAYEPKREYLARPVRAFVDLDGDGDRDAVGDAAIFGWRRNGPAAGSIRQFGDGVAGSGAAVPVLGASGPVRPGSKTASVRLRRCVGGAPALLVFGSSEASVPNTPVPGMTLHVGSVLALVPVTVSGPVGVAGAGTLDIPIPTALLPLLAGSTLYLQFGMLDPGAPFLLTASNGLEIRFGL